MSDLSLNAQLGGRLKALQNAWNHDTASETLATVFDIILNKWGVQCPSLESSPLEKGVRVSLKARHVQHFAVMASLAGCNTADIARSVLIQWLCAAETAVMSPVNAALPLYPAKATPKLPPAHPKKAPKAPKQAKPKPEKAEVQPKQPLEPLQEAADQTEPVETKPRFDAKSSLLGLKRG